MSAEEWAMSAETEVTRLRAEVAAKDAEIARLIGEGERWQRRYTTALQTTRADLAAERERVARVRELAERWRDQRAVVVLGSKLAGEALLATLDAAPARPAAPVTLEAGAVLGWVREARAVGEPLTHVTSYLHTTPAAAVAADKAYGTGNGAVFAVVPADRIQP